MSNFILCNTPFYHSPIASGNTQHVLEDSLKTNLAVRNFKNGEGIDIRYSPEGSDPHSDILNMTSFSVGSIPSHFSTPNFNREAENSLSLSANNSFTGHISED